jgi:stress response protein SCP2
MTTQSIELIPGQNIKLPLSATKLALRFHLPNLPNNYALESCAFLLNAQGKTRNDDDFIFFNQLIFANNVLQKTATGHQFNVDLSRLPLDVAKIVFTLTIDEGESQGQSFSALNGCYAEVSNVSTQQGIALFKPETQTMTESAVIFFELYRHQQDWKLRALGQGFKEGLSALAEHFGVTVSGEQPAPPPAPVPPPTVQPSPRQPSPSPALLPPLPPVATSVPVAKIVAGLFGLAALVGSIVWYENYAAGQDKIRKQERLLFAKAVSQQDFENYLQSCHVCEAKEAAEAEIREFEKKNQHRSQKDQEIAQEHQTFLEVNTPEKLKSYLLNCISCLDKKNVAQKRKQLAELAQARAEGKLPIETITEPLQEKPSVAPEPTLLDGVAKWIWTNAKQALTNLTTDEKNAEGRTPSQNENQ